MKRVRHHVGLTPTPSRRLRGPASAFFVVVMVGTGIAVDRLVEPPLPSVDVEVPAQSAMPVASPADAGSSTWFCAGGSTTSNRDLSVSLTNLAPEPARGRIAVVAENGTKAEREIEVPATSTRTVSVRELLEAEHVAAVIELDRGGLVVEHTAIRGRRSSTAPCSTSVSNRWFFADGATTRDATTTLWVFNPFSEDALIDVQFATEKGRVRPAELQGVSVTGGGVRSIDVGSYARRRRAVSTTISARTGRVIAERLTRYDGSGVPEGMTLVTGSPAPADAWFFPDGLHGRGRSERYALFNPGSRDRAVLVEFLVDVGEADPFELTIPAHGRVEVRPDDEERVPAGVGYSVSVTALDGPIVAEQTIFSMAPSFERGVASTLGSPLIAPRWAFGVGSSTTRSEERIAILNPLTSAVSVRLRAMTDSKIVAMVETVVGPGGRHVVRVGDYLAGETLSVLVDADGPIVAARTLARSSDAVGGSGSDGVVGNSARGAAAVSLPQGALSASSSASPTQSTTTLPSTSAAASSTTPPVLAPASTSSTAGASTTVVPASTTTTTVPLAAPVVAVPVSRDVKADLSSNMGVPLL